MDDRSIANEALDNLGSVEDLMIEDYDAQASDMAAPHDEGLRQVALLAHKQVALEEKIEETNNLLKTLTAMWEQVAKYDLPNKMQELGISSFRLEDGRSIEVKPDVFCGITEANQREAFEWLRQNGYAHIIKSVVTLKFDKSEDDVKLKLRELLAADFSKRMEEKEAVHPSTLKATIKERDEQGKPVPDVLFGVHRFRKAKIK